LKLHMLSCILAVQKLATTLSAFASDPCTVKSFNLTFVSCNVHKRNCLMLCSYVYCAQITCICRMHGVKSTHQTMACRCAEACIGHGFEFLDAPISGGPHKAKDGSLTIMCGGPQATFAKVEPVMQCMGSHVRLMGPHGSGTAAKLVSMSLSKFVCMCCKLYTLLSIPALWTKCCCAMTADKYGGFATCIHKCTHKRCSVCCLHEPVKC